MRQEPRALTSCDVPTGSRADPAVPARRTPATRRPWGRAASLPFRDGSRHTVQTNGSGWLAVERDGKVEKIPIMFFSKVWVFDKIYRIFWKRYQKRFPDWICKSGPFTQRPGIQRMEKKTFGKHIANNVQSGPATMAAFSHEYFLRGSRAFTSHNINPFWIIDVLIFSNDSFSIPIPKLRESCLTENSKLWEANKKKQKTIWWAQSRSVSLTISGSWWMTIAVGANSLMVNFLSRKNWIKIVVYNFIFYYLVTRKFWLCYVYKIKIHNIVRIAPCPFLRSLKIRKMFFSEK